MEPRPPGTEPPLPRGPGPGPESELQPGPEPDLNLEREPELEPELDLEPEPELDVEPEPELEQETDLDPEPELDLDLWALEPAAPGAEPPPWCPKEAGDSPGPGGPAESPPEEEPRLRPVFDALDRDGDGFVRVEEFVQFATAYGAEQVRAGPGTRHRCRTCARPGPGPGLRGCRQPLVSGGPATPG